uniref:Secreted protein n=1 Tax=Setaria viridis TaxID=4556 RepID=A0A4U6TLG0_SETVI|nr:hypothetical protein SEVIR_7G022800v2 [Setaria viridis]
MSAWWCVIIQCVMSVADRLCKSSMYSAGDAQMVCSNKQNKVNPRVIINIAGHTGSTCSVQIYY